LVAASDLLRVIVRGSIPGFPVLYHAACIPAATMPQAPSVIRLKQDSQRSVS